MRHEIVRTIDGIGGLRVEWNALVARSRANSIFQTWQWLETWLELRDPDPQLLVICIRDEDGRLVGLAPFYKSSYRLRGLFRYRALRLIGDADSGAEYLTWIADSEDEEQILGEIAQVLRNARSEWDLLWMPQLGAWDNQHLPLLRTLYAAGIRANTRPCPFSAFPLPDSFDDYLKSMSSNRRQQMRRMKRKILENADVRIEQVKSPEQLASALDALFDLHGKRWRAAGEEGVFARNPGERLFYERFAPKALAEGWLSVYMLLDKDEPKAVQFGYIYGGSFLQLQEGFDPDYSPHVGNVLRSYVIEECIALGLREYDFLGGHSEHKRRWLAEIRDGVDLLATAPKLRNMAISRAKIWPTGRLLRPEEA